MIQYLYLINTTEKSNFLVGMFFSDDLILNLYLIVYYMIINKNRT